MHRSLSSFSLTCNKVNNESLKKKYDLIILAGAGLVVRHVLLVPSSDCRLLDYATLLPGLVRKRPYIMFSVSLECIKPLRRTNVFGK